MKICLIGDLPKDKVMEFFKLHWGSSKMVISSGVYDCSELDGFAVVNEENEMKIINNAVDKARKLKPEIPLIGNDGIPIRDEIELIKRI